MFIYNNRKALRTTCRLAAILGMLMVLLAQQALADVTWPSGTRRNDNTTAFITWRGVPLGMISGWIEWKSGWEGMNSYVRGSNPRTLRNRSPNVVFAHALFPAGGTLSACAAGAYDTQQRTVATLLSANGGGSSEIRLGWEGNGNWFPWAVNGQPEQWKQCFTRIAKIFKAVNSAYRICWSMAKKGVVDARTMWPADASAIDGICLSHYDDAYDRIWGETYKGGPWGLRAWLQFARDKGRKIGFGEWGVGRDGDNPQYIQDMYDFFKDAGRDLAYEAYFNTGKYQLYPVGPVPKSSALYAQLFSPTTNRAPVAGDDTATTTAGSAVSIAVLGNDSDPDGDTLTISAVSDPPKGTATINAAKTAITYTPDSGFSGTDSFSYTASDGHGGTDTATVSVTVSSTAPAYLGCYKDQSVRDIDGLRTDDRTGMTVNKCASTCRAGGFPYFGVQAGKACFCGIDYNSYGTASNCTTPCPGDSSQICGGSWANSVYRLP